METLTGKWKGSFNQVFGPDGEPYEADFSFEMDIIETEDGFTGTCIDLEIEIGRKEKSKIQGFREGSLISFTKQYENSIHYDDKSDELVLNKTRSGHEITYYGNFDPEHNEYSGAWEYDVDEKPNPDGYETQIEYGQWEMSKVNDSN